MSIEKISKKGKTELIRLINSSQCEYKIEVHLKFYNLLLCIRLMEILRRRIMNKVIEKMC